jgi:hypothetical protein
MTRLLVLLVLSEVYVWTDSHGEQHYTDDLATVPKGVKVKTSEGEAVSVMPAPRATRPAPVAPAPTAAPPRPKRADETEAHPTLELRALPSSLKPGDDLVLQQAAATAQRSDRLAAMGGLRRTVFLEVLDRMEDVTRRGAPEWAGGFTTGPTQVYLLSYAIGTLCGRPRPWNEMTLHELAHAQLWQWAGSQQPRWFKEGYAMWVARQDPAASTADIAWWAVRFGGQRPLTTTWSAPETTTAPVAERSRVTDAYGVSCEGVRFLVERFGESALKAIITGMHEGAGFDEAFRAATGLTSEAFEQAFLEHLRPAFHERAE